MENNIPNNSQVKCTSCGSILTYEPGTNQLKCIHCGHVNTIDVKKEAAIENDYNEFLRTQGTSAPVVEVQTINCQACGAQTSFDEHIVSHECAFCGTPLVSQSPSTKNIIQPRYILPFRVKQDESRELFKRWLKKLWFAPNKLKHYARGGKIMGIYIPYWTFDAQTYTQYSGERGDNYQVEETYTDSNGETQTRTVTKTRWSSVSGDIDHFFDDMLVVASQSLPTKLQDELEPWDLEQLLPYDERFLAGFRAESYQIGLEEGYSISQKKMEKRIKVYIKRDIGGDKQRIHSSHTDYTNVHFKHILLPIWISAYKYNNKSYRFLVNGRTGEVQGERPYSWIKIAIAILLVILFFALVFVYLEQA